MSVLGPVDTLPPVRNPSQIRVSAGFRRASAGYLRGSLGAYAGPRDSSGGRAAVQSGVDGPGSGGALREILGTEHPSWGPVDRWVEAGRVGLSGLGAPGLTAAVEWGGEPDAEAGAAPRPARPRPKHSFPPLSASISRRLERP